MSDASQMEIMPLGSGCEVGRSCVITKFKNLTVMFDCGVHPAYTGVAQLPYLDEVDTSEIDLLLITHFHMDHVGALPYLTEKTTFAGRVFMTHPTKAVCKLLLHDSVKMGASSESDALWDEQDLVRCLEKVELIDYHQVIEHKGVRFTCYNAGHVLGAAMFMIEIGGVRVLYTGDFSRQDDRHLLGAETPVESPHVLIVESTYGVQLHETREVRETRFTSAVHAIVRRGGRCLIPVFALGRSQELLLVLDAYWRANPELHDVPIYYASGIARKCMRVYQTYINMMNAAVRDAYAAGRNPWEFSHVRTLPPGHKFDDGKPCVVMASPGMLQQGLSRELFEAWCSDPRNGLVMPGYSVAGTLAHHLLSEPTAIKSASGDMLPVKLSISYVSFSAHSDFAQTSDFVAQTRPTHVVHVHGSEPELMRLQRALSAKHDPKVTEFLAPKNCQAVHLHFSGDKICKVEGSLAKTMPKDGARVDATLLYDNFKYSLIEADELHEKAPIVRSSVIQRPTFAFDRPAEEFLRAVGSLFHVEERITEADKSVRCWMVHEMLQLEYDETNQLIALEWEADPLADTVADAVAATLLELQARQLVPGTGKGERAQGEASFILRVLEEQFGEVRRVDDGWVLSVCGSEARVKHIDGGPLDFECANEIALLRLREVVQRAARACSPVERPKSVRAEVEEVLEVSDASPPPAPGKMLLEAQPPRIKAESVADKEESAAPPEKPPAAAVRVKQEVPPVLSTSAAAHVGSEATLPAKEGSGGSEVARSALEVLPSDEPTTSVKQAEPPPERQPMEVDNVTQPAAEASEPLAVVAWEKLTLAELKAAAKKGGIKLGSVTRKADIIELLRHADS